MDPLIEEQASGKDIEEVSPKAPPARRPWREPVEIVPEQGSREAGEGDREWAGGEATGIAGGGMPEAAGQAEDPGTDTDLTLPPVKKRIEI
jgi:hypothetical protein